MTRKQEKNPKSKKEKPHENLVAIRKVKSDLAEVHVTDVAAKLGWSRQNIYYHLNEDEHLTANLDSIAKISGAIALVKIDNAAKTKARLQEITKN